MAAVATVATDDWSLWSTSARLVVTDPALLPEARRIADAVLERVELASSRFRPDSEILTKAPLFPVGALVSDTLAELMRLALASAAETDGDVDPTLANALGAIGYDHDIRLILDDGVPVRAIASPRPGWASVRLVGNRLTVPAHLGIDLGATAKAAAADQVAARIVAELGCGVLVSLGGDIATAGPAPAGGWQVLVQDAPLDPSAHVTLAEGLALATSSTQKRRWTKAGRPQHHILDPASGLPAEPVWRSVTVAAGTCHRANTLSTAAIVRGHKAVAWLRELGVPARLVDAEGVVVSLGGWPDDNRSEALETSETPAAADAEAERSFL
ncbi:MULTISPECIES: FAD:protein FMN transferase [unclassified Cryobacterium]|uniref:FAD:protein FMN transferase n=1 Tax=unclassified Cryobacterium TaxID=2649013 RepID=UPI001068F096|nr:MULTISPECIES: FAD:protein FMN transferase [unclassified Cryobacterium]MDY7527128.1 FAD:protein FMN transferase [Cryobacterium sp. 10C2]MDY7557082.1 FAD:protein FMN transferase [Cryobacterium sp. 10C3]MEB0003096.1 FAD:protein FMN transferase [Cryobacterium sp. RTC2.1]MEB0286256.1 FAD:protein FMN transferase [Cryobacterium sp. 10S3]MEB0290242.1 FAD:protein FMN transferase [Cryobacterium sp. 10C2]